MTNSSRVASGVPRTSSRTNASWAASLYLRYPPMRLGTRLPVALACCISLITVLAATSNRLATELRDAPAATAFAMRLRISSDRGRTMAAGLQSSCHLAAEFRDVGNPYLHQI